MHDKKKEKRNTRGKKRLILTLTARLLGINTDRQGQVETGGGRRQDTEGDMCHWHSALHPAFK